MTTLSQRINEQLDKNDVPFHSPAHAGKLNARDLTELDGLDNLQYPEGVLKESQEFIAQIFGAQSSFLLVNGASVGMQAACIALQIYLNSINDKRPVLVARNVHKSVIAGIILAGLTIEWFEPEWNEELGIYTVINRHCEELATKQSNAKYSGIILTNPTYEGFSTSLDCRASLAMTDGPIIVDEAHGAHYQFSNQLPATALEQGADISVQSWHKTLGSLGQTGVLHISKQCKIPSQYIEDSLRLLQTTSPSYILMESLTETASLYADEGQGIVEETIRISKKIKLNPYQNNDPYRFIIQGPGFAIEELLEENGILIEAAYENFALLFINPGNDIADITKLNSCVAAIKGLCQNYQVTEITKSQTLSKSNLREAYFEGDTEIYAPCPPGIAREIPGQKR
ncbi:MAG: aminotransferase class I/II-fold pyridoxal phosphate-dependent enzyme [Candidatus Melainabacteria bacterium]|jgi:arginine/lysine/ornithine decarboxylase|nr:aminotransferase class I/II-fold pyridoxal phosphate-dependent enzyme [Candidatus Melainabacteria bacterium]